ncbi:four helix bundle protein [bacterium]|nr:four helix bundle protein [bacterium]
MSKTAFADTALPVADFRFENLEVWKMATEIGHRIADLADGIDSLGKTAFANRLRECSYLISGILAEGSSCPTKPEFAVFVGQARGATLEIANLIIFFSERELISEEDETNLINMLKRESKMLDNFRQSLERASQPDPVGA